MSLLMQELLGMDKAGSYSETGGQRGGGYNQEDKYEKEKNVRKKSWIFGRNVTIKSIHCWLGMFFWTSQNALKENFHFQNFMKEMEIMKKLHHPNLVKMYGICVDKLPFYIILVHLLKWLVRWYIEEETKDWSNHAANPRSIARKETWRNTWRASSRALGSWSEVCLFVANGNGNGKWHGGVDQRWANG